MNASAAAYILDPLADDDSAEPAVPASAQAQRAERIAPDLIGLEGLEAVGRLRTSGFIAAIESVPTDSASDGSVIQQEPPGGTPLDREGVVTLSLAVAPEPTVSEIRLPAEHERNSPPSQDDTDEWFAELAALGRGGPVEPAAERQVRVRRALQPGPSSGADPATVPAPDTARTSHAAVHPILPRALAHFPWRRGAGVAGIVICTVVTTRIVGISRLDASGLERRLVASERRAALHEAASLARLAVAPQTHDKATAPVLVTPTETRGRARRSTLHRAQRRRYSGQPAIAAATTPPPGTGAAPPFAGTTPAAAPPPSVATPASTPAAPAQRTGSQFAYLGQ